MKSLVRTATAFAAVGLLAACAGGTTVISNEYRSSTYDPKVLNYPAGKGRLYTEVVGHPFGGPDDALAARVLSTFEKAHFGNPVPLTTDPAQVEKSGGYRLVALFDPAIDINYGDVCAGNRKQQPASGGETTVLLTYCLGNKAITSVRARQSGLGGVDDPAFEGFLAQASSALFPPRPEERQDRGDFDT